MAIKKQLKHKYEFYGEIIEEVKNTDNSVGEKTIAQEISNGLIFEAIQHSLQYIEDLFALIHASKKYDFFIRDIIQYKAGKIEALIKTFKISRDNICKSFHFPLYTENEEYTDTEDEIFVVMQDGIDRLGTILSEITEFYKQHHFFYNQYKHGLSIALRPFGDYSDEQVEEDKTGKFKRSAIVALDSLNFKNASKNQYGNTGYLMMPCFSENIRPHINQLEKDNNLLRFVMSPPETNIDSIVEIAQKTKRCLHILIHNLLEIINEKSPMLLRMPADDKNEVFEFNITVDE